MLKVIIVALFMFGCSSSEFKKTVDFVDIQRFMGDWYVHAGRTTFLEEGAHNSLEQYSWNEKEKRIDITFSMRIDSFKGKKRVINQKAWIHNQSTNAHWKVSPFWPIKFDYLVLALDPDYQWSVIGVPSQKWIWIMSRNQTMTESQLEQIIQKIRDRNYNVKDIQRIPQSWP